ncbi:efflux transporter outer membrane subunit [Neisseria chenwenguii]|uniref:Uncharacterized protein n=1 Tax=Neisseria chenwenguii TaxID=1853278 RepID=A0A220S2M2_9NEIS|nr:efflux transporter outer membrane subunit [Neisseria chenwenguii]ASK27618.1 hypothetical protein BG910_07570 [Neisseria chenwenguii]ROV55496.1 efflux transporter outer membrane subunit [Neisseria chenwenguii]
MKYTTVKTGAAVIAATALAACAPFGKQAPLAEPAAHSLSQAKSAVAQDGWWKQLGDQKLNRLIEEAVKTAPDLRAAQARFDQAQAQLGITRAANLPQAGLTARGIGAYVSPKPTSPQAETDHTLLLANAALQGSWSFDFWGKNRAEIASVLGKQQALAYEAVQTRNGLAHAVAAQYFAWQALNAQSALISQRIETVEKIRQLMQRRINAKLMPSENLYPLELQKQQLQMERLSLEQKNAQIRHSLAALCGKTPDGLMIDAPEKAKVAPVLAVDKVRADILATRPDIAAQKALLSSRMSSVAAAKAEFYPNIELKVLAGLSHIDAFNVVHGRSSGMLGIVPAVNLPIFTAGALKSKLAGRRAEYNEQVALYDQTVLNAMRAAADAVSDYQNQRAKQNLTDKMAVTAEKSVQSARSRVKAGLENGLDTLKKQDEALKVKMQAAQQRAELLTAWSNVHNQLGGGFRMW